MAYEIYKKELTKDEYFNRWDHTNYRKLTEGLKKQIYARYLMKCRVFIRDSFTCQNSGCMGFSPKITLHHIKWQKNGGEDKARNGVTLCKDCHHGYHKGRIDLVFPEVKHLPPHIRGHTFKVTKDERVDWKKIRSEMKKLRKNLKQYCGLRISWEQVAMLMQFLEIEFDEDDD